MICLETITLRNFLSVGAIPQTFNLHGAPLTLIFGDNGSGKTTVLQAVSFVVFDEPLTKIKKDNLINSINEKQMELSIEFTRDGIPYRIERGRKPNYLRFLVGADRVDVAQGDNRQTQIEIERVVGMSHTMFAHIVALNTFTIPFLKMRPAEQREVIEELMGIGQLSQYAEQIKLLMDSSKDSMRNEEAKVAANAAANARIEQAIAQARQQAEHWRVTQDKLLRDLHEEASQMSAIDIEAELAVFDQIDAWTQEQRSRQEQIGSTDAAIQTREGNLRRLRTDLTRYDQDATRDSGESTRLQQQIDRLRNEASQTIDGQIDRLLAEATRRRADATKLRTAGQVLLVERETIVAQLASPDAHHCVTCGQGLAGTDHLASVIQALERKEQALSEQIVQAEADAQQAEGGARLDENYAATLQRTHEKKQQTLREQADALESEMAVVHEQMLAAQLQAKKQADSLRREIAELQTECDELRTKADQLFEQTRLQGAMPVSAWDSRDALWRLRQDREKLAARLEAEQAKANPSEEKIIALTSTLATIDYGPLNALIDQLKHEQFLYKLLTSKDSFVRKRLIDQNLSYLNRTLNQYLQRLGLPHEVGFQPDLSVEIALLGRDFDFEQLSRGEMNRVILATSFSFRDLWESLNHTLNLYFCDECLDQGTDQGGVEAAVQVLQHIAQRDGKNIFLVSHREELKGQIDHVLRVSKEDQFTVFAEG